ncbi:MAG: redox-regulated ATPase YchF [bacterium]|nr:redox-regulated ATPase YchF [bacterium]
MNISVGIVGLPNVGKSTLFKALTKKQVDIANYPFCTIEPNIGIVKVPDERLEKLAQLFHPQKTIPAIVEFVDIAGLVKGAHEGEGLGNQFLSHIREVQAICHVVRCFEDSDIVHVQEGIDPVRDIDIIHTELLLKDLETVRKRIEKERGPYDILDQLQNALDKGMFASQFVEKNPEAADIAGELQLLTSKPLFYVCNSHTQNLPKALEELFAREKRLYTIMNLKEELDIEELGKEASEELKLKPKLPELVHTAYKLLDLITFFTAGADEVRAWTIRKGDKAPDAGGAIHSDFKEKFIRAAIIHWDKLIEAGGVAEAMAKGWLRTEGKEYVVRDGDVIEIKHG